MWPPSHCGMQPCCTHITLNVGATLLQHVAVLHLCHDNAHPDTAATSPSCTMQCHLTTPVHTTSTPPRTAHNLPRSSNTTAPPLKQTMNNAHASVAVATMKCGPVVAATMLPQHVTVTWPRILHPHTHCHALSTRLCNTATPHECHLASPTTNRTSLLCPHQPCMPQPCASTPQLPATGTGTLNTMPCHSAH
jgi:hypothetical protein